jgi:hypothetical protein
MTSRNALRRPVPKSALPDFAPVPRKSPRHDGWTPARQKAFIEALADTGCVAIAARMVNMSQASVYQLRRQPGAESFRAAMEAAQTLGLQPVKDEAFDRAMNGQLVPVFVAGKLMGFRRKKNDRLLMFILRHYGQDAQGRKTTINYFSSRATAGAASGEQGAGLSVQAAAQASTTTIRTILPSSPVQSTTLDREANILNAFEGVALDAEAQAEIHRTLAACAERRRALEADPENDPECDFVRTAPGDIRYLGELESGVEGDWVEYRPEGEHRWEGLGEGGEAERIDAVLEEMKRAGEEAAGQPPTAQPEAQATLPAPEVAPSPDPLGEGGQATEIDRVLAEIEERRAKLTPEEIAAEQAEHEAEVRRMREEQTKALPTPGEPDPNSLPRTGSGDPRLDWRNWSGGGYAPPEAPPGREEREDAPPSPVRGSGPPLALSGGQGCGPDGDSRSERGEGMAEAPTSPRRQHKPRKPYKKRTPKPPFTPPEPALAKALEARKAQAIAEVAAERRELAAAEEERRRRREAMDSGSTR